MADPTASTRSYVAPGAAAHVPSVADVPELALAFVLVPQFTMLAFTSAVEPFRIANQLTRKQLFRWMVYSADGQPVQSSTGLSLAVDGTLPREVDEDYVFVCGGVTPHLTMGKSIGDWLRVQWRHGRNVGGICTGAYALARAGILDGHRFTLHWENIPGFTETFPALQPLHKVFCIDGRILTSAGGVASADLALHLIAHWCGPDLARKVMEMCLLSHNRAEGAGQISSTAARMATRNPTILAATAYFDETFDLGHNVPSCLEHLGVEMRQVQRLFRKHLGITPAQYLSERWLAHARMLLAETNLPVTEVAIASGFSTRSAFSRSFRKKFGCSPHSFSSFSR
ncbi:GlxA family transcriptional regulator [Salipiger thiooxidans]|uniref:GlxA family transcriptional regulator n=1 Tax=Salipiger thiooxidans TaxID=282683 RepID=UPI001A909C91|nr:GlxA family transcriptional regulator [Salipiger thiooxidans]MBN8188821.1 GlxA family transcriptional regulator [Salipiger thiooxidans]